MFPPPEGGDLSAVAMGRRVSHGSLALLKRRWRAPVFVLVVLLVGGHWLFRTVLDAQSESYEQRPTPAYHLVADDEFGHFRRSEGYKPTHNMRGMAKEKLRVVEGERRNGRHDDWAGKGADETLEASRTEPDPIAEKQHARRKGAMAAHERAVAPFRGSVPDDAADDALCGARVADADEWAQRFANGNPAECRLLLAAWVAESDTHAQKHMVQLAALARRLHRTLVLPNVHRGAMGTCLARGFDAYYDLTGGALVRDRDAKMYMVPTQQDKKKAHFAPPWQAKQWLALSDAVSFAEFRSWAATRQTAPTAQIVDIEGTALSPKVAAGALELNDAAHLVVETEGDPSNSTHPTCLSTSVPRLDFAKHSPLQFHPLVGDYWHVKPASSIAYGHAVAGALALDAPNPGHRDRPRGTIPRRAANDEVVLAPTSTQLPPDVLVVSWNALHPMFDIEVSALPPLGYAQRWTTLAASLVSGLGPFIAVHWRLEHIDTAALGTCADALITNLLDLLAPNALGEDVGAVWLATDYPMEGREGTFTPSAEANEAMRRVKAAFGMDGKLERVRLTTLAEEMSRSGEDMDEEDDAFEADPGLMAILDKSVAVRAPIFVTGGAECGVSSAFTTEIRDRRAHVIQGTQFRHDDAHPHAPAIRNLVQYFG
ncbi:hypothetical protein EXIGLDRAFT_110110 [Exidia glandulosa HHB12029]|uniref:Uncharacterized protein n=1 Tax=Exidia glandulosa HHB12029 TaxID=1314781 RepID=A0A165GR53_EXIGL|nr:hypothetical protein EXIGLDRAFT_110110 [Exidia glandulosa HHB12029]